MKRWKQCAVAVALAGSMVFSLSACTGGGGGGSPITTGTPIPGGIGPGPVLGIEQGFTEEQQQGFWFTTQGTEFIPYDWLLALEQANSTDLFRSTDNINRLGYIPPGFDPVEPRRPAAGLGQRHQPSHQAGLDGLHLCCLSHRHVHLQGHPVDRRGRADNG